MSQPVEVCQWHVHNDPCEEPVTFKLALIERVGTVEMMQRVCVAAIEDVADMLINGEIDGFQVTRIDQ